jgi:hypothetical protein
MRRAFYANGAAESRAGRRDDDRRSWKTSMGFTGGGIEAAEWPQPEPIGPLFSIS